MSLLAIDPGCAKRGKGSACAVFDVNQLAAVGFAKFDAPRDRAWLLAAAAGVEWVAVERPQVDRRTQGRERAIVDLAWAGAALAYWIAGAAGAAILEQTPTEWKGNARKPQHHARMWAALTDDERALLGGPRTLQIIEAAKRAGAAERWRKGGGAAYYPSGFEMHNILDAVALGLHALGRMP